MHEHNKPFLNIACAIDDSFAYPLSVMLVSLLENNKHNNIKIHLFSVALSNENVTKFENIVSRYGQYFQFYRLNKTDFEGLPVSNRISYAAYYRILMPNNISSDVQKFLYLDADIIIIGDLTPLFEIDLDDKILAATNDIAAIDWSMHKKHNIPDQYLYFNSGVLLINKTNWIQKNATHKVLSYIKNNIEICDYHDQDGLNGALYDQRQNLSPIWNLQIGIYFINKEILEKSYELKYTLALSEPIIIHFNGIEKPWHYVSAHPYRKHFAKYACLVNEFRYIEKFQIKKFIKRYIIYVLKGWVNVNKYYYYKTRPIHNK
jgi:lipopolysaccharide biosynthesis glycosyltransferase